ncbi:MAG: TonB-dependent receptor [Flavisolibacter sp.]|nr:TonB-dependent receptor [Flavisolibacter sp.]
MLKKIYLLLFVQLLVGLGLYAQVTTSSITGTVLGTDGQPLAGATVTAVHLPSATTYTTVANREGLFNIANMRVGGPYRITINFVGLQPYTLEDVNLQLAEPFRLNATLREDVRTLEAVTVTGGRRRTVDRTGITSNIGVRQINTLPSISRSINDLARLTPQSNGAAVGGGNYRQNYVTVDGSDFNNAFGIGSNLPAGGNPVSLDALEEITISITPFDIRQSNFIGSSLNAVTRSGTNNFSGSVYTYFRNQGQQGNTVKGNDFTKQNFDFKQYGFRVGGPIIPNKLFFFINGETEKTVRPGQQRFAATANAPFGSAENIARPTTTELDAISDYLAKTYGYETGPYQGYDFEAERKKLLARIDWNISNNHRLNVRYSFNEGKDPFFVSGSTGSTGNTFASGAGRTNINALHFKNSNYFQETNFYSIQAELNSTFGRIGNNFRISKNNQNEPRSTESSEFPFVDILKDGQPFTSFGFEPFSFGNLRDVEIYSLVNNVTSTIGKHNLLGGIQIDYSTTKNGFQPLGASYYRFNSWEDFVTGQKPNDFAYTHSLKEGYEQVFPGFKFMQYSGYVQDEVNFSPKFKLTIGLRADLTTFPDVEEVKTNPLVADLTFANGARINTGELPKPTVMFSPRLGFIYDPYENRSLMVRGGTGIFTGRVPFVWIVGQSGNSGMLQVTRSFNGTANTPGPFNPDRAAYFPSTVPPAGTVIPSTVTAFAEDFTMPQTWKTSLGLDVRLPAGFLGTLVGIFNKDINVTYSRNLNLVNPVPLNIAGYPDNRLIYPSSINQKFLNPLTNQGQTSPTGTSQFNAIVSDNESRGFYFSLTAKLEKQFAGGLYANIAYTKSVAANLYDGAGDQPFNTWNLIQTVNGPNTPTLAQAGYIVPDRVIAAISYRKEYFKYLGTTISMFYEGSHQGRFSYLYGGDLNRDIVNQDLIYIPRNPSEITFVSATYAGVTYTPQQQSDAFFAYMEQDDYLRKRKGQYAERNGALFPWRNQFDVKLLQDIFTNIGGKRNTLQLSVDVFNFGNLLNSRWGVTQSTNASSILVPTNANALVPGGTVRPTFRLQQDRGKLATETFRDDLTLSSTYYMQFGLRYIFN